MGRMKVDGMLLYSRSRCRFAWIATTILVSAVILANSTTYFLSGPTPLFLVEKESLLDWPLWRTAFYCHVIAACFCLMTGPLLMVVRLLKVKGLHSFLGYVYLNAVLWIAAPAGLVITPFAKGGFLSALGFLLTGIAWWWATWVGYRMIVAKDVSGHIRWMVRSYAIALSAVWFRLIQIAMSFSTMSDSVNYTMSVWLSLFASLWVSETFISRAFPTTKARNNSNPGQFSPISRELIS